MGFTFKALLPPFVCFILLGFVNNWKGTDLPNSLLGVLIMMWGFAAFCTVVVYWIARIWKRATRDSRDPYWQR